MEDAEKLEEVAALADDLEQSPWVDWGLWGDGPEATHLRVRAADFANPESKYLEENSPQATPAVQLQRALGRFLGRS
ncbi:MAG: hypothetical protein KF760_21455 [Candidatus Eremiobacteraeota bacterium]|nr:hypothetical protein [Candidatus Eremiobacteraeota bacterium]MCW5867571.1 hypothetical protein [Candidatus Eremiobacteraeota bacterium]